jgi:hypothetical protein
MNTVIFNSENAVFKFDKKELKERLFCKQSEYDPDEITQLLELISTDSDETILSSVGHHYFGFVVLDSIRGGKGSILCKICGKTYDADQLTGFTIEHGKSPFDVKQKMKGGIHLFEKRKNPSLFGGRGFACPEGHTLISMETWRT